MSPAIVAAFLALAAIPTSLPAQIAARATPDSTMPPAIAGRVVDEQGRPIRKAKVFVQAFSWTTTFSGPQIEPWVGDVMTDANGLFAIAPAKPTGLTESIRVVATAEGQIPALAFINPPGRGDPGVWPPLEMTLATRGGEVLVKVLKAGRPVPAAGVRLTMVGVPGEGPHPFPSNPVTDQACIDAFSRVANANANGLARFRDLTPGLYRLTANEGPTPPNIREPLGFQLMRPESNIILVDGLAVVAGQTMSYTVELLAGPAGGVSSSPTLHSPVMQGIDRLKVGSIRARLLDDAGRPASGAIVLSSNANGRVETRERSSLVDADGYAVFDEVPSGKYTLDGRIDGLTTPPNANVEGPLPPAEALRERQIVPRVVAIVRPEDQTTVDLQAVPVGYVRGTIRPAEGRSMADYRLTLGHDLWGRSQIPHRIDPGTGHFLIGPTTARSLMVEFWGPRTDPSPWPVAVRDVHPIPGDVIEVDVDVAPAGGKPDLARDAGSRSPYLRVHDGQNRTGRAENLPLGTVRRADGRSPASWVNALAYLPHEDYPIATGVTDAAGRLTWVAAWIKDQPRAPVKQVDRPTAVVWLPGETGATIVELVANQPFEVTLPPPIAATGRVTFGGRPVDVGDGQIQIVAAYQGRGVLDEPLSVRVTAEPDGRFSLRGLTPGRYRVRATRHELRSEDVDLDVEAGVALPGFVLDLPEP